LVPAVAVTAFSEEYPPDRVNGWAAYFRKPLKLDNFVETVASILNARGGKPTR
jgi:hypothetical protein